VSRKRKRPSVDRRRAPVQAVPEEILAEGSGPVEAPIEGPAVGIVLTGVDAIAGEPDLVAVADDLERRQMGEPEVELGLELEAEVIACGESEVDAQVDAEVLEQPATIDEATDGEPLTASEAIEASEGEASDADPVATLPTSAISMDSAQLKQLVEALVFASDKPITVLRLRQLTRVSDTKRLEQALAELTEDYRDRGLVLQQVSGGYQFRTKTQWAAWVQQLIAGRPVRLSRAQLETLAIIAYRQPITRPEIDDIRGVDSSATLKLLIDRALIRILGKKEEVGRPMLYGTTKEFLDFFSLGDLRELPTLREYSELTDESRKVISDRLGMSTESEGGGGEGEGGEGGEGGDDGSGGSGSGPGGGGFTGGSSDETMPAGDLGAAVVELDELLAGAHEGSDTTPEMFVDVAPVSEALAESAASDVAAMITEADLSSELASESFAEPESDTVLEAAASDAVVASDVAAEITADAMDDAEAAVSARDADAASGADASGADASGGDASGGDASGADASGADASGAEASIADAAGADASSGADAVSEPDSDTIVASESPESVAAAVLAVADVFAASDALASSDVDVDVVAASDADVSESAAVVEAVSETDVAWTAASAPDAEALASDPDAGAPSETADPLAITASGGMRAADVIAAASDLGSDEPADAIRDAVDPFAETSEGLRAADVIARDAVVTPAERHASHDAASGRWPEGSGRIDVADQASSDVPEPIEQPIDSMMAADARAVHDHAAEPSTE